MNIQEARYCVFYIFSLYRRTVTSPFSTKYGTSNSTFYFSFATFSFEIMREQRPAKANNVRTRKAINGVAAGGGSQLRSKKGPSHSRCSLTAKRGDLASKSAGEREKISCHPEMRLLKCRPLATVCGRPSMHGRKNPQWRPPSVSM